MLAVSLLVVAVASVGGGFCLGWKAAGRPRLWPALGVGVAVFELAWIAAHDLTDWTDRPVIYWHDWGFFEPVPRVLGLFALLGICLRNLRLQLMRGLLALIAASFAVWTVLAMGSPILLRSQLAHLNSDAAGPGPVMQTAGWSCSAAAGATLLGRYGVPASERRVAELAHTEPLTGTDDLNLWRALEILALPHGLQPRLRHHLSAREAATLHTPCLFGYQLYFGLLHTAVLVGIHGDRFEVEDPLTGRDTWSRSDFEKRWVGDAIELHRGALDSPATRGRGRPGSAPEG